MKRRRDYTGIKKTCQNCKNNYIEVPERRIKFCSLKCFGQYSKNKFYCAFCHKEYITTKTRNVKYCSRICMFNDWRGKSKPEWVNEKISKGKLKGKIPSNGKQIRHLVKWLKVRKQRKKYFQSIKDVGMD
jgi:hypothetical protein